MKRYAFFIFPLLTVIISIPVIMSLFNGAFDEEAHGFFTGWFMFFMLGIFAVVYLVILLIVTDVVKIYFPEIAKKMYTSFGITFLYMALIITLVSVKSYWGYTEWQEKKEMQVHKSQ
jgi:hypothetical protein